MPRTIKDEDGQDVEVLSEEEIEAEKKAAADVARSEAVTAAAKDKADLEAKLKEATDALAKAGDKSVFKP